MSKYDSAKQVLPRYERMLRRHHGVTSVAVGDKHVDGVNTGEPCLRVGVARKVPASQLTDAEMLPAELEGIPLDVEQEGVPQPLTLPREASSTAVQAPERPCPAGVSCGLFSITAGTLGLWCNRNGDPDGKYLLSNFHVLAATNTAESGWPIYQPGPYDGGSDPDTIARLESWAPIRFNDPNATNFLDAACARAIRNEDALEQVKGLPPINGIYTGEVLPGLEVQKVGRTTGLKRATVVGIDGTVTVTGYGDGLDSALFQDQIITSAGFSAPGDSGSTVWTMDMELIGLLFAGSDNVTIVNQIGHVFRLLDLYLKT